MKKIRITRYQRYLLYVVGLVVAILFTVTGVKTARAEDETTVTVMLHKVLLDENDTTTKYDNQGTELAINDSALLNGAGFTVYDVTSLVDAGSTLSDLNKLNDTYGASYFDEKGLKSQARLVRRDLLPSSYRNCQMVEKPSISLSKQRIQKLRS